MQLGDSDDNGEIIKTYNVDDNDDRVIEWDMQLGDNDDIETMGLGINSSVS